MDKLLEVKEVVKSIENKSILKGLTFSLDKGKVLGVMGPNGSGKTTLLNSIFGFLRVNSGEIKIDGANVGVETKKIVSYLQDKCTFPKWMKVKDVINYYEKFFEDFNKEKMEDLLSKMKLQQNTKIKQLSKGMNEKLSLSLILSREAKLYLLDEPVSGVDPVAREKIIGFIIESLSENSSLIITTHYVGELERIFDDVLFIGDGKVVEQGEAESLRIKYGLSIDGIYRKIFREE
jgi:ABC-2 type transport system ATP-binding protein